MIVYADDRLKQTVMKMWKICFGDEDDFMKMYFRLKYKNENTLVKIVGGKPVASLQILPYEMTFGKERIHTGYISGACTLPEERKKGYMDDLLIKAFHEMRDQNVPVTTLIPQEDWLFGFYEKFGYTPLFDYNTTKIKLSKHVENIHDYSIKTATLNDVVSVADFYDEFSGRNDLTIQKSENDWYAIFEDYFLAGGEIFLAFKHLNLAGVCFVLKDGDELFVKNILTEDKRTEEVLLSFIATHLNVAEATLVKSGSGKNAKPLGMARITNVMRLLEIYAGKFPTLDLSIRITDAQMIENNGMFLIRNGVCSKCESDDPAFEVPVSLLTRLLFGYRISDLPEKYRLFPSGDPVMQLMME